jgi:hypothetical protein
MDDMKWVAEYATGGLPQYNEDGSQNNYKDIDRSRLKRFALYKLNRVVFVLHISQGQSLIYRRRVAWCPLSGSQEQVWIIGTTKKVKGGTSIHDLHLIFNDGHIEAFDKFSDKQDWFRPISFLPEEING